jgi:hypothetical protein
LGTVRQVFEHFAQKVVIKLVEKTRLLLPPTPPKLLLLPKPPRVASPWCDERQCLQLQM